MAKENIELTDEEKEIYNDFERLATEEADNNETPPVETPPAEIKTETRGRHKKDCECPKCVERRNNPVAPKPKKGLLDELSEYKSASATTQAAQPATTQPATTPPAAPVKPAFDVSKIVTGALLLVIIDALFPTLILTVAGFFDEKYKRVTKKGRNKLRLDKEEQELLKPAADEVVKIMLANMPPEAILVLGLTAVYFSKFQDLDEDDFKPIKNATNGKRK